MRVLHRLHASFQLGLELISSTNNPSHCSALESVLGHLQILLAMTPCLQVGCVHELQPILRSSCSSVSSSSTTDSDPDR